MHVNRAQHLSSKKQYMHGIGPDTLDHMAPNTEYLLVTYVTIVT